MKHFISALIAYLFLTSQPCTSQVTYTEEEGNMFQIGTVDTPFIRASSTIGNDISGSIYLNEEWNQATIFDYENTKKIKLLARFNAYHSEIEILKEKDIIALYPKESLSVLLNNRTFVPVQIKDKNKPIFAEIITKGKYELYRVFDVKINKAPSDSKLLSLGNDDTAIIVSNLYYKKDDLTISKFPSRKKDVLKQLSPDILDVAKKNNYSLKKEKDIIAFYTYLNNQ